jgi:GLPGLI family protein
MSAPPGGGMHDGGMMLVMRNDKQEEKMYINRETKKVTENRSIMDKLFLVNTDLKTRKWKLTGEQDTIAGYTCMQAILQEDTNNVVAWFTPQIPVSVGPKDYGQLPGLILKIDIRNGKHVYRASLVDLKPLQPEAIVIPTKGKEVTDEEFKQLRRDKMKEMGFGDGHGPAPGSNVQIMIK